MGYDALAKYTDEVPERVKGHDVAAAMCYDIRCLVAARLVLARVCWRRQRRDPEFPRTAYYSHPNHHRHQHTS